MFASQKLKLVYCVARMAEWSKAVDLSPTISGCAGSNPAPRIFLFDVLLFCLCSSVVRAVGC